MIYQNVVLSKEGRESDRYFSVKGKAVSKEGLDFAEHLYTKLNTQDKWSHLARNGCQKHVGAFIFDMLRHLSLEDDHWLYRSLHQPSFKGSHIGYGRFKRISEALENAGLLEVRKGYYKRTKTSGEGSACRYRPTVAFTELAIRFGITPGNYRQHFGPITTPSTGYDCVIKIRASKSTDWRFPHKGKMLPTPVNDPQVTGLISQIDRLNHFLEPHTFDGCDFDGLFRQFNEGDQHGFAYNKGGRMYAFGDYQQIRREDRKNIRINGERVSEIDVSASHLTLAHAMLGVPVLPNRDLYAIPGIANRTVVKMFVTITLGVGHLATRWPKESKERYLRECLGIENRVLVGRAMRKVRDYTKAELDKLQVDYPIARVREEVAGAVPILRQWEGCGYTWADLQYRESQGLIAAMETLAYKHGVPTLPLHDSLIGPVSKQGIIAKVMKEAFLRYAGVSIKVTAKE